MTMIPLNIIFMVVIMIFAVSQLITHNTPKATFYIAMYPNQKGIDWIRTRVLDHISNPKSPHYGKFLSTETINRLVRPPESDINKVINWLDQYDIHYRILGDTIHCVGDIFVINHILGTKIIRLRENTYGSIKNYTIPSHLTNVIQFIDGLTFRPQHFSIKSKRERTKRERTKREPTKRTKRERTKRSIQINSNVSTGFITREVMERVYNMTGNGLTQYPQTSVGAMEYQGQSGFSQKDMTDAQAASNVPVHNVSKNHIVGYDGPPDGESQLDMGVIWWGNGNATLWYEDYNGWMFGWASSFLNRKHYPEVVSISWGWNEKDQCTIVNCSNETNKQYVQRSNDEFMKLAAKGVTILVSSGDAGSPGRTNEACVSTVYDPIDPINPVFPGSSEWVISVGGTYLVKSDQKYKWSTPLCHDVSCANGTIEQMTTFHKTGWTSGAGWAWWTETPKWQQSQVKSYLNSGVYLPKLYNNNTLRWNPKGRAYPDVSAFGHLCTLHDQNEWVHADGTSCSSPVFAGIIAYLNDHQRSQSKPILGFANPLLYKMYESDPSTFHDITVGNSSCTEYTCCNRDYGFKPIKGWDVVSGLGTPNIGNIIKWLDKNT